jgi:S1-C subfamily serine protease
LNGLVFADAKIQFRDSLIVLAALAATALAAPAIRPPRNPGSSEPSAENPAPRPTTYLGVAIAEVPPAIGGVLPIEPGTGLLVNSVLEDSPAAAAGIQRNDVLARINDQVLVTPKQLQILIARRKPGDQVEVTLYRKGEKRKVLVTLMTIERLGS